MAAYLIDQMALGIAKTGYGLVDAYAAVVMAQNMISINNCSENKNIESPLKLNILKSLSPNPASNNININYNITNNSLAQLVIQNLSGNDTVKSYDLNTNFSNIDINLNGFFPGIYVIKLIVNGKIVDSKTFIKR